MNFGLGCIHIETAPLFHIHGKDQLFDPARQRFRYNPEQIRVGLSGSFQVIVFVYGRPDSFAARCLIVYCFLLKNTIPRGGSVRFRDQSWPCAGTGAASRAPILP